MSKEMRKTVALALAVRMAMTDSVALYISGLANTTIEDVTISTSNTIGTVGESQNSVPAGTIKVTGISVKAPAAAIFEMNPSLVVTDPQVNRITTQSGECKIISTSVVPMDVSVTAIVTGAAGGFTNDAAKLTGTGNDKGVMFAVRKSAEVVLASTARDKTKWFNPDANYGSTPCKVGATAGDNTLATGAMLEMRLYGATAQDWSSNETFAVTLAFIISIH